MSDDILHRLLYIGRHADETVGETRKRKDNERLEAAFEIRRLRNAIDNLVRHRATLHESEKGKSDA